METVGAKEIVSEGTRRREEVGREGKVVQKEEERDCVSQGSAGDQNGEGVCVPAYTHACMCMCACEHVRVCVHECVCVSVCMWVQVCPLLVGGSAFWFYLGL